MINIIPLNERLRDALEVFFGRVPEGDRTFFQEDVSDPVTIDAWLHDRRGRRFVASVDGNVQGYLALVPGVGWEAHVAQLRVVVDIGHRRAGIGRALARRGLLEAVDMGMTKVVVEAVADQDSTIALFNDIGFDAEALLKDHVRTADGELRDLLILAHRVDENWESMSVMGVVEELA